MLNSVTVGIPHMTAMRSYYALPFGDVPFYCPLHMRALRLQKFGRDLIGYLESWMEFQYKQGTLNGHPDLAPRF